MKSLLRIGFILVLVLICSNPFGNDLWVTSLMLSSKSSLVEIERAQVPAEYFKSLSASVQAAQVHDGVVISYVGPISYPDLAAEMADILLRLEGTRWVICMGVYQDNLILAVRTRSRRGGAGQLVRAIVGDRGTAGGHGAMAGGQVPMQGEDPEQVARQLGRDALQFLKVPAQIAGKPII